MIGFFIYKLWRAVNQFIQMFLNLFTSSIPYYFLVTPMGNQVALCDERLEHDDPLHLLVVYYTSHGIRYRFSEISKPVTAAELRLAYRNYQTPVYRLLAIGIESEEESLSLPPESFTIVGSVLGTRTFHYWLCNHYFHIPPKDLTCTVIDDSANLKVVPSRLAIGSESYVIE